MNLNDVFQSEYITKEDLGNKQWTLTIKGVYEKKFDDGPPKILLTFEGADKGFVCNVSNATTISEMYGASDLEHNWPGQKVTLYADPNIMYGKKRVGGVRVRLDDAAATAQSQAAIQQHMASRAPPNNGLPNVAGPGSPMPGAAQEQAWQQERTEPAADPDMGGRIEDEIPFSPEWR